MESRISRNLVLLSTQAGELRNDQGMVSAKSCLRTLSNIALNSKTLMRFICAYVNPTLSATFVVNAKLDTMVITEIPAPETQLMERFVENLAYVMMEYMEQGVDFEMTLN